MEEEIADPEGNERAIARLALVLARASYQSDDKLVREVLEYNTEQEQILRTLAWCAFTAARYVAARIARLRAETAASLGQVA